ncbi:MAG: hypothetical protein JNK02_13280 [Planctomycetes bacterium]|nr:hypothetical protein [Planctomycetota bacterium]
MILRAARRDEAAVRAQARAFLGALGIAALALPGAWPGSRGVPDPVALLVWLACCAPAAGALAGGARLPAWPFAAAIPGAWAILFALVAALAPRDLATPAYAVLAAAGLFASGYAVGRLLRPEQACVAAASLFLASTALVLAPLAGGWLRAPWPGPISGLLLDLSPATLLAECAGLDWLRHPAVYDAAGAADLDPRLRAPYRPELAGGLALVMGCGLAYLAARIVRRSASAP